jgi:hypothetical protein
MPSSTKALAPHLSGHLREGERSSGTVPRMTSRWYSPDLLDAYKAELGSSDELAAHRVVTIRTHGVTGTVDPHPPASPVCPLEPNGSGNPHEPI